MLQDDQESSAPAVERTVAKGPDGGGEIPAGADAPVTTSRQGQSQQQQQQQQQQEQEERYCWVCFATEEDDKVAPWVQPCNCRGATKWVHQSCLKRWIDEKQKGNPYKSISCPQCQTRYIIILPSMGSFGFLLERLDVIAKQLCPSVAAGAIVCSIYWSAITFGAVTVLQTTGFERGMSMMEQAEPIALLLCLPTIPVALVIGRMFRWEDIVLRFLQTRQFHARKYPVIRLMLPVSDEASPSYPDPYPYSSINSNEPLSATRILCGALLLPTVSTVVGKIFFKSIENDLHRTLLGGFAFVAVKGMLKIYFHQQKHNRAKQRQILDYTPENVRRYVPRGPPMDDGAQGPQPQPQQQQQQQQQQQEPQQQPQQQQPQQQPQQQAGDNVENVADGTGQQQPYPTARLAVRIYREREIPDG